MQIQADMHCVTAAYHSCEGRVFVKTCAQTEKVPWVRDKVFTNVEKLSFCNNS